MSDIDITEDFFKGRDFENRVLYYIVSLTGNLPVGYDGGTTEAEIAIQLAKELNITSDFVHSGQFHSSRERGTIIAAIQELDKAGYVEHLGASGSWAVHPTRRGRSYVSKWHDEWERKNGYQESRVDGTSPFTDGS